MALGPELEELQEEFGQEPEEHCGNMCDLLGSLGFIQTFRTYWLLQLSKS